MKSYRSTFAAGLFIAATIFAAVLLAPMNAAEAGGLNMSSSQLFSQPTIVLAQSKGAGQCKSDCDASYDVCLISCGTCTSKAQAVAGCNRKYGKDAATCKARCDK